MCSTKMYVEVAWFSMFKFVQIWN